MPTFWANAGNVLTDFAASLFHYVSAVWTINFDRLIHVHPEVIENSHKIYLENVWAFIVSLLIFNCSLIVQLCLFKMGQAVRGLHFAKML